ncbi:MAG: toxin-antitoxin system YwqK family antitoxin [Flavobacteriales bacterium]
MRFISCVLIILCSFIAKAQKQHYVDFYGDGEKASEGYFIRGLEHGEWKFWDEDGKLKETANYYMGQFNGSVIHYYPSGQIKHEGYFILDKQDSIMRSFSASGLLLEQGNYVDDDKIGTWEY